MSEPSVHYAGEATTCRACGEAIVYLRSETTGKLAPITLATYPNGNIAELPGNQYRTFGRDRAAAQRADGRELRLNHFVNCPHASRFGRKS